jgi:hypothetical protein
MLPTVCLFRSSCIKSTAKKNNQGGVSLDFEEGEVASSMFNGGAAMRGRNFSGNY